MTTLAKHPTLGMHIGVVIPRDWGSFVDVRTCYDLLARRHRWISVLAPGQNPTWNDAELLVVYFTPMDNVPARRDRRATTALVYSEALDPDLDRLLPAHRKHWETVSEQLEQGCYDGLLGHTPLMVGLLGLHQKRTPAALLPLGWEPEAMGCPRGTMRVNSLTYHGSAVGRRRIIVPYLQESLGHRLVDVTGQFGRGLIGALEASYGSLYVAHSEVASFSTWRLWQALAAGCAVVGEPGDSWPFIPGQHYYPIGPFTLDNLPAAAAELHELAERPEKLALLESLGERAVAEMSAYTTTYCVETYLVPAGGQFRDAHAGTRGVRP